MKGVIEYKGVNGIIQINPSVKKMSYKALKSTFENKVVNIDDLAKTLGIKTPKKSQATN